jgi:hypothetical protein
VDADLDHDWPSCWCCCRTCEHVNPFFNAAVGKQDGRGT